MGIFPAFIQNKRSLSLPDLLDRKILAQLQQNCKRPIGEIAELVGLSLSACARRISLLEERGYIDGYGARLNPARLDLGMMFFVELALVSQTDKVLSEFEAAARQRPEVLECHLMTGRADYLIKVAVKDTADYEDIYREVISTLPHISRIHSALVMKTVKPWVGYPTQR